jgi:hypothetical protein
LGVVTYRDYGADGPEHVKFTELTEDLDSIAAWIQDIYVTGGGDEPEDVYDGLLAAIGMGWRNGVGKFIILMGDAPAKDPAHDGTTLSVVAKAAEEVDPAHVYPLIIRAGGGDYDEATISSFGEIAKSTGGSVTKVEEVSELVSTIIDSVTRAASEHKGEVHGGGGGAAPASTDWQWGAAGFIWLLTGGMVGYYVVTERKRAIRNVSGMRRPEALLVLEGHDGGRAARPIPGRLLRVGRGRDNDLTLADSDVSRNHFEIRKVGDQWILRDLQSSNGTIVNSRVVRGSTVLRNGDAIGVGSQKMVFRTISRARRQV